MLNLVISSGIIRSVTKGDSMCVFPDLIDII